MLAVLDPHLLHFDDARGLPPLPRETLADIVLMLHRSGASIPDERSYWAPLQREFLSRLHHRVAGDARYTRELDQLRALARPTSLLPFRDGDRAGFDVMFDPLGPDWIARMRHIVVRAALTDTTILVTRLIPNRNARRHDHDGRLSLVEKTHWELRVGDGAAARRVACVCSSRNVRAPWTCRYADALAGHEDRASFPFCAPPDWREATRAAFRTRQSRPCWADGLGHFWAEPAAQQEARPSYHWDVYLNDAAADEYGLSQINVAKWRSGFASDGEKPPGELHHVPEEKKGKLRKTSGWSC